MNLSEFAVRWLAGLCCRSLAAYSRSGGLLAKLMEERSNRFYQANQKVIDNFGALAVMAGPFSGLRYPRPRSAGSSFLPKILGTYELELQEVIKELIKQDWSLIVNVGAAEGYYAVGFARTSPGCRVYAFEMDEASRELCREVARENGVDGGISFEGECRSGDLSRLCKGEVALVLVDCEGFEDELFLNVMEEIAQSTILVECHESARPGVTERIRHLFRNSHNDSIILPQRRTDSEFPVTLRHNFSKFEREAAVQEWRAESDRWLLLTPIPKDRGSSLPK